MKYILDNGERVAVPHHMPRKAEGGVYIDPDGRRWEVWTKLRKDGTPKMRAGQQALVWIPCPLPKATP